jgi:RNA polymerase sigma factor (sigma-70 family)
VIALSLSVEAGAVSSSLTDAGMHEEFRRLVDRYHIELLRLAYGMSGDRQLAEDAVQSCWQRTWATRTEIRDWERIQGWLFTVTANEVKRQLRRRRVANLLFARSPSAEDAPAAEAGDLDLKVALAGLSLRDRQLVTLRYGMGLTSEAIAPIVGLSPSGVRVRMGRVLEQLRKDLTSGG